MSSVLFQGLARCFAGALQDNIDLDCLAFHLGIGYKPAPEEVIPEQALSNIAFAFLHNCWDEEGFQLRGPRLGVWKVLRYGPGAVVEHGLGRDHGSGDLETYEILVLIEKNLGR